MPWVGLQFALVVFSDHTHFLTSAGPDLEPNCLQRLFANLPRLDRERERERERENGPHTRIV